MVEVEQFQLVCIKVIFVIGVGTFKVASNIMEIDNRLVIIYQIPVSYTHLDVYKRQTYTYPMPLFAQGKDEVFVGRIRRDESQPNSLNMWIVADNLRKGAATNLSLIHI